jgi:hypothetical protein
MSTSALTYNNLCPNLLVSCVRRRQGVEAIVHGGKGVNARQRMQGKDIRSNKNYIIYYRNPEGHYRNLKLI